VVEDLSRLIDTANAPIFGIDADGLVNEWNVKAAQLTGRSKDEVMGKHMVKNFISAEHQASVEKVLNDAMNGVATADFELPLFTKSGECREVLLICDEEDCQERDDQNRSLNENSRAIKCN